MLFRVQLTRYDWLAKKQKLFTLDMGCFPEKTTAKYEQLAPQKQEILKKYAKKHPEDSSFHIPISTNDIDSRNPRGKKQSPRSSPKKSAATPVKNRKYYRGPTRRLTVEQRKIAGEGKQRKIKRKGNGDVAQVRRKGKVIELPFRPHVITAIETPSQSVRSSLLSKLEHHPSLFFVKLNADGQVEMPLERNQKQSEKLLKKDKGIEDAKPSTSKRFVNRLLTEKPSQQEG